MTQSNAFPLADVDYLARSEHRVRALLAMARRPQSRDDLLAMTGVSRSTIRRTLREFEKRSWIRRDGGQFEATRLGAFVAAGMQDLVDRLETERTVREVWEWLPPADSGFTVEMCADATVTVADADDPYRPVKRFLSLLRETDRFRFVGFDVAFLEPCKDELCAEIIAGMDTEIVTPPRVAQYIRRTNPELFSRTLDSGNLTVRLHDDLPTYGVSVFEERVAVTGYDPDSLSVRALIDTDEPAAREWAEGVYESYSREIPTVGLGTAAE